MNIEDRKDFMNLLEQLSKLREENELLQQLKDEDSLRVTQLATECSRLSKANVNLKSIFYNTVNLETSEMENLFKCKQALEKVREYVIKTGIDHKWDMRFQRWKSEILQICDEVKDA